MKSLRIIFGIVFALLLGIAAFGFFYDQEGAEPDVVALRSFAECADRYAILESYPRQCRTPEGEMFVEDIGNELEKRDLIHIASPRPNQLISSPLEVTGEARGYWFFEASFPVRLVDNAGNTIFYTYVEARDDWMTTEFVPFYRRIEFEAPPSGSGTLILEKDNPSGLPEHADALRIPVRF